MGDELLDDFDLLDKEEELAMNYAPFDKRFKAFGIDFIIIIYVFVATFLLDIGKAGWWDELVLVFLFVVYFAFQESSVHKASLGKRYCGLIVCDFQKSRIGLMSAVLRQFGKILSYILSIIALLVMLRSKHRQGIHDFMVKTVVLDGSYENKD